MEIASAASASNTPESQQHTISCTECQRRKQKCSRQWPCNHCQSRKVPHMCHFASNKKSSISNDLKNGSNGLKKRKGPEPNVYSAEPLVHIEDDDFDAADALKALGYLQSDGNPLSFAMLSERNKDDRVARENDIAVKEVPPRIYCDAIVRNYLEICNYWYYPIYPPQFLEAYNTWWDTRSKREKTVPEFTCLLLRVLANSTQCVAPALRNKLESELGETLQDLTQKYHDAAERLSNLIPPGVGGIMQVQQLFLTAVWLKSESLFINAWHALSDAIRYAQEAGLHDELLWSDLSEFDCEIRRRIWTTLYIWDRFMGMMLSRPLLINDRKCYVKHPSVNLEFDPSKRDLPCPHKHMELQQQLCEAVIADFDGSKPTIRVKDAEMAMGAINRWLDSLPPVYRLEGTDTQYDTTDPYLVLQRLQTVCMGHSSIVSVLKSFLTQTYKPEPDLTPQKLRELQNIGINQCVKLMDIAQQLADLYIPDYNKYFLIVFTPLDISALLSSAIIHDVQFNLPRRGEILQMVAKGLTLIRRLSKVTRTGSVAEKAITQLVKKFILTPEEEAIFRASPSSSSASESSGPSSKRRAPAPADELPLPAGLRKHSDQDVPGLSPDLGPSRSAVPSDSDSAAPTMQMHTSDSSNASFQPTPLPVMTAIPATNAIGYGQNAFPNHQFTNDFAVQEMVNFDFAELGPVFNWQNVNLFENNDHVFDFAPGGAL